ncbi:DUF3299 domain-containing protein [Marinilongibacter aquaticus]|uniref:DUF3299 domain-containing protein n=1 Tax=Marinilongibacter aquaticus TaxID=2975157 RepID=UPI0021BDB4BF|nr:DUF3299 domain-containing protein [Marinilongibacter aquaticus]UBM59207.1 DUF3299 domain-containing protein [Marinilongibacter aquaticus]
MKKYLFISFFAALATLAIANDSPLKISWQTLTDVTFNKIWNKDEGMFILVPEFGEKVKTLKSKQVEITGYMIPIDVENNYYVLSANPYASCFFCGGAGPESVMTIKFKTGNRRFDTDERLTLKGNLVLNSEDLEELTYILTDAEVVKK